MIEEKIMPLPIKPFDGHAIYLVATLVVIPLVSFNDKCVVMLELSARQIARHGIRT